MRCRQVWPADSEVIKDQKLIEMMSFWADFKHLSLAELLFPMKWEGQIEGSTSIAAVLDFLIRSKSNSVVSIPTSLASVNEEETPIFDSPVIVDDDTTAGCIVADSCTVVFKGLSEPPLRFQPKCGATIEEFSKAQSKLAGPFDIVSITMNGRALDHGHVMEVGQLIVMEVVSDSTLPKTNDLDAIVSPTVAWTQPAIECEDITSPPRKVSKFDVGECVIPAMVMPDDRSWLDASALVGLQGQQFLKLQMPCIQNAQQLWSLRHQYLRTQDRLAIIESQEQYWADDEIRFHMNAVVQAFQESQLKQGRTQPEVCMIDPLVFAAWVQNKGFDLQLWAKDHPEIFQKNIPVVTVALLDHHWVPIFMSPLRGILQVHTWDGMGASHEGLDALLQSLAIALGFQQAMILREHRLFFTSELCGALAIAFLRFVLMGTLLPTECTEATVIHCRLRDIYVQELQRCQIARRPWVWGAGDPPKTCPVGGSSSDLHLAVNITRDQRIDLINEKGFAMGDDEMRFHVLQLVANQPLQSGDPDRKFTTMEPLIFNCWNSIGRTIADQWAQRNPQIHANGQNVITAVAIDDHWLPIWMVPEGDALQIHTFQAEVDFGPVEEIFTTIARQLGFQTHAVHRIPGGLPDHVMCGAHALSFLAHVVMHMPLPADLMELRTLHTNMRAPFVAHLYAIGYTPKPVVWGNGTPRESGQLPIMPEEGSFESQDQDEARQRRLHMLSTHSYAMGDDEIDFHLLHLLDCHTQGPREVGPIRHFVTVSPRILVDWLRGDDSAFQEWKAEQWSCDKHFIAILLLNQHWIPVWIAPLDETATCHTLGDFAQDDAEVEFLFRELSVFLGFQDVVIHRVPHGVDVTRRCGAMSICFLAHIVLRTRLPWDSQQLSHRCWRMKEMFAEAIQTSEPSIPSLWGWGIQGEFRLLPKLPDDEFSLRIKCLGHEYLLDMGMSDHEVQFHLVKFFHCSCAAPFLACAVGRTELLQACLIEFGDSAAKIGGIAFLHDMHWQPVLLLRHNGVIMILTEDCWIHDTLLTMGWKVFRFTHRAGASCGVVTLTIIAEWVGLDLANNCPISLRRELAAEFQRFSLPGVGCRWGFGPQGQLVKNLVQELSKHGIPQAVVEDRALAAIKTLGSEQIMTALNHRQPWKQLKILGTNSKFQFVLPSELAQAVENNKGKPIGPKGKGKGARALPPPAELDPTKLQLLDGTFHCNDHILPQLNMKQIGPVSSGVILISLHDAEPYLRSGAKVSTEPLAPLVLQRTGTDIQTALPHARITVPCRCIVNNEPVLAEVVIVQVGTGLVEKANGHALVSVDTPDVVTLKVMVYKDELRSDWAEFCNAPIRNLVSLLPKLKKCSTDQCTCPAWHNEECLPLRDPILDVWRRQFLRAGFKPCPAPKADIFSVCIRIPQCILESLLAASGSSGAYCEPRSADGKEILSDYVVVWSSKHTLQEMQHLMQTNPAVTGLARLGDRRGLRVRAQQGKVIHQLLRPDTVFLPNGPKNTYTVGPLPYGVDRQAVAKILRQAGWESRPLQPSTPCPGRGVMWLVQATEDPEHTIIATTSGDIVINKQRQEPAVFTQKTTTVGSADTLALCGTTAQAKTNDADPWAHQDPWRSYQKTQTLPAATGPTEGMQQIEERIQSAVLAKIQQPMEDDIPDRVQALEGQVHQLLAKQQGLEVQFHEHSSQHSQQINALQNQVTAQAQQLHGHLENQNQNMQSLFEQQMQQIRGLLSKRPREEGME